MIIETAHVIKVHERVIGPHELQGLAKDKLLDAVLERVHNRQQYGFITDVFDLAACYGAFIAKSRCFNDANKRTAASMLYLALSLNRVSIEFSGLALGDWIIDVATDKKTELELAGWLRAQAKC